MGGRGSLVTAPGMAGASMTGCGAGCETMARGASWELGCVSGPNVALGIGTTPA